MRISEEYLQNSTELRLSSSVVTVGKDNTVWILAIILNDHGTTITKNKQVAVLIFLFGQEEEKLTEIGPELLALDKMKDGEIFREINQFIQVGKTRGGKQPKRPPPEYDKIWFPTQKTCQILITYLSYREKSIHKMADLQKLDLLDPQKNEHDKEKFLARFNWSRSNLNHDQIFETQKCLLENDETFAEHWFEFVQNTELKVKLTPAHELPVYVQCQPTPIHLRDEILA